MKQRLISAAVFLTLLIPVFILPRYGLPVLAVAIIVGSLIEIMRAMDLLKKWYISVPYLMFGVAVPVLVWLNIGYFFTVNVNAFITVNIHNFVSILFYPIIVLLFYTLFAAVFAKGKLDITKLSLLFMLAIYITIGAVSIVAIHEWYSYWFLMVFFTPWLTDTGAHLIGSKFGKRKLIPEISPNKTVTGAVGGIIFNVIAFITLFIINNSLGEEIAFLETTPSFITMIIIAIVSAIVVIMGDLVESLIKRHYGIKDFSNIMPGHGGIFDRFDSMIAVAPVLLIIFYYTLTPQINIF